MLKNITVQAVYCFYLTLKVDYSIIIILTLFNSSRVEAAFSFQVPVVCLEKDIDIQ